MDASAPCQGLGLVLRHRSRVANIVARICKPASEDREHMDELEAARKKWSVRLDLTDADWIDAAQYATLDHSDRMGGIVALQTRGEDLEKALRRPSAAATSGRVAAVEAWSASSSRRARA